MHNFQPSGETWEERSRKDAFMPVLDPADKVGKKNQFIDYIHKLALQEWFNDNDAIVLDFGCGIGRISNWLATQSAKVVGIDVTKEMIEKAKEFNILQTVEFVCYDGLNIPFPNQVFDKVCSVWVLQHINNKAEFLRIVNEFSRILQKEGKVIFIEQVTNERSEDFYIQSFTNNGFELVLNKPIRKGKSILSWLVARYGRFVPMFCLPALSNLERFLVDKKILQFKSSYTDYIFIFKKQVKY